MEEFTQWVQNCTLFGDGTETQASPGRRGVSVRDRSGAIRGVRDFAGWRSLGGADRLFAGCTGRCKSCRFRPEPKNRVTSKRVPENTFLQLRINVSEITPKGSSTAICGGETQP